MLGKVVDLVGMAIHLIGLVRGWVDAVVLVKVELVDLVVDLMRLVVDQVNLGGMVVVLVELVVDLVDLGVDRPLTGGAAAQWPAS